MKIELGPTSYIYPIPVILAGANVDGKPNYELLGQCGVMGVRPPIVYISSGEDHYTNIGILRNQTYSINFPTTAMLAVTDYCGIVSGHEVDKSVLFESFYGELGTAPMIAECPVNLECRVIKEFSIEHRQVFVGEVVMTYVDEALVREKGERRRVADLTQLDPIMYALDNRYYGIGEPIGVGYQEGKDFQRPGG